VTSSVICWLAVRASVMPRLSARARPVATGHWS
jgi:hypothetical protein